jgi:hypothetical protein
MADALDSKSSTRKSVWVQVPPPVLLLFVRADRVAVFRVALHGSTGASRELRVG